MTDDPLQYSKGVSDEPAEKAAIQVDAYGLKTTITPSAPGESKPQTWGEVWKRVNRRLMSIVSGPFDLVVDTIDTARSLIRGLGGLKKIPDDAAQHIEAAHRKADAVEDQRQAISLSPNAVQDSPEHASERLVDLLADYHSRGIPVQLQVLEGDRIGIFIVPPGQEDVAAELSLRSLRAIDVKLPTLSVEAQLTNPVIHRDEVLKWPLSEMGLSTRVFNVLSEAGIELVAELGTFRPDDLLAIEGIGKAGLKEIRSKLAEQDLSLKDDY